MKSLSLGSIITALRSLSSLPSYNNPELEEKINENKNESEVDFGSMHLNDDDMAIVTYYLLQNNDVSDIILGFLLLYEEENL